MKITKSSLAIALSLGLCGCIQQPQATPTPSQIETYVKAGKSLPCLNQVAYGFPMAVVPQVGNSFRCVEDGSYGFALDLNPRSKTPMWVAEHLTKNELSKHFEIKVERDFRPDPEMDKKWQASPEDYVGSGYDRGTMASSGDFSGDASIFSKTFYFSNVVPQIAENKAGIWRRLEDNVRDWTEKYGEVYVISGPVYMDGNIRVWLGSNKARHIAAPTHLYKVIYAPKQKQMIAFLIPNDNLDPRRLPYYATNVLTVEHAIGYNLFPMIPDGTGMIDHVDPNFWPIR